MQIFFLLLINIVSSSFFFLFLNFKSIKMTGDFGDVFSLISPKISGKKDLKKKEIRLKILLLVRHTIFWVRQGSHSLNKSALCFKSIFP